MKFLIHISCRYVQARLRPSKFSSEQDLAINNGFRRMDSLINELEDYELTERVVIQELSRHYIAVIIGTIHANICFCEVVRLLDRHDFDPGYLPPLALLLGIWAYSHRHDCFSSVYSILLFLYLGGILPC